MVQSVGRSGALAPRASMLEGHWHFSFIRRNNRRGLFIKLICPCNSRARARAALEFQRYSMYQRLWFVHHVGSVGRSGSLALRAPALERFWHLVLSDVSTVVAYCIKLIWRCVESVDSLGALAPRASTLARLWNFNVIQCINGRRLHQIDLTMR
jgi:hypothetical protein